MKSFSNSHTHCQVAPAATQTKTWQRVCLPNRSAKPTDNQANEKEHRSDNITYTQARVTCLIGQVIGKFKIQSFVGSLVVKIPACV